MAGRQLGPRLAVSGDPSFRAGRTDVALEVVDGRPLRPVRWPHARCDALSTVVDGHGVRDPGVMRGDHGGRSAAARAGTVHRVV